MRNEPTHDTPIERDEKADELTVERVEKAAVLAAEVRRFRWEIRTYYTLVIIFIIIKEF